MSVKLKLHRENLGLTQSEVAKKVDISRSYYTNIELGIKTPAVPVAKKIAEVLNLEWVIFYEDKCSFKEQNKTA